MEEVQRQTSKAKNIQTAPAKVGNLSEIQKFNEIMKDFVIIDAAWDYSFNDQRDELSANIIEEIMGVMNNAYDYPEDYNLTARIYTQETNKRIGEALKNFGLELYQKYMISGSKDDIGEVPDWIDYAYIDREADFITIYPEFIIRDIEKFIRFLKRINNVDEELARNISTVINSLGTKVREGFIVGDDWSDEELDIYNHIGELYDELLRLDLQNEYEIEMRCDYFIAIRDRQLHYIDDEAMEIITWYESPHSEILTRCKQVIMDMDNRIKESRPKLEMSRNDPATAQYMTAEFHRAIKEMIEVIKTDNILSREERQWRLNQFSDYLAKMKYINAECFFEKPKIKEEKRQQQA